MRRIETERPVVSLHWAEGEPVDLIDGAAGRSYRGRFDQVVVSPSGRYSVMYAERGTAGLLLRDGEPLRELIRAEYSAEDYDYPVAVGVLPDGREVVVHCPEEYNVLRIDDAETGRPLLSGDRRPMDVFHSRLAISPGGRHLLAAGWYWHPYGVCMVFDLRQALDDPAVLDDGGVMPIDAVDAEVESACWLDADRLVVATTLDGPRDRGVEGALGSGHIGVWSIGAGAWTHRATLDRPAGTMLPCGDRVVALFGHPRVLDPTTGKALAEWPDVDSGTKSGSYGVTHVPTPIAAVDPDGRRLAVAQSYGVAVVDLPPAG
ncbi:hypothetical protein [Dactylosporangium salmoneum]|uniref:Uncharacterized protein n=1 Tax=Dactylosporangium salmoneum TaxID=53361 RepID=A0ABP5TZC9_9ACTN